MPKIQRETQKIFCNSADSDQIAVFGSMATGTPVYSNNIEELQNNEAFDLGWDAATLEDKAPFMEEMNGVQYGITKQLAYNFQEGIPEYDAGTTYYIGSICKVLEEGKPVLYTSLTDENLGNNPVTDATNWERLSFGGGGLEIGDIGFTQMAIDESKGKRRILNGQLIIQDQYLQFTNIVKASVALNPDLACTEEEWQTEVTMNTFGLCGKFVIDNEGGTIRLPKYPNYFIGGVDNIASVVGNGKALGITSDGSNVAYMNTGIGASSYMLWTRSNSNELPSTSSNTNAPWASTPVTVGVSTNPATSGLEAHINKKQIAGTYFIQVATGAETEDNIINEIELNNPFSLLDYKFSEYELNNISWLRSNSQYNSKAIYPAVYDLLLKIYNGTETKAGVSVKLSTEDFSDVDFVLNTTDETFMLPTKVKLASGKAVVGNGMALGLTNGTRNFALTSKKTADNYLAGVASSYGASLGSDTVDLAISASDFVVSGVTTDTSKSGIETSDSDLYLYFYVGETVQNANLINAGRIEEKIVNLIPDNSALIASYGRTSSKAIDLTLGASGTTYVAPATGTIYIWKVASASGQYICFTNNSRYNASIIYSPTSNAQCRLTLDVTKGDEIKVDYTLGGDTRSFRFIYALGSESEAQ